MMKFIVEIRKKDFEYYLYEFVEATSLETATSTAIKKYDNDKIVKSLKVTTLPKKFGRKKAIVCYRCPTEERLYRFGPERGADGGYDIYHHYGELMFLGRFKGYNDTKYTYGLFAITQSTVPELVMESTKDEAMNISGIFRDMSYENLAYRISVTDDISVSSFITMASHQNSSWCISLTQGRNPQERELEVTVGNASLALEINLTYG